MNIKTEKLENKASNIISAEKKIFSAYDKMRMRIIDTFPKAKNSNLFDLKDFLFLLPDFFMLVTRVLVDIRIKKKHKIILSCIIGYLVMPIDLIPDFIPIIGYIDDLVITVLGLDLLLKEIDHEIILSNWSGKVDLIETIRKIETNLEKHLKAPFLKNIKAIFKTFGVYSERNSNSNEE